MFVSILFFYNIFINLFNSRSSTDFALKIQMMCQTRYNAYPFSMQEDYTPAILTWSCCILWQLVSLATNGVEESARITWVTMETKTMFMGNWLI